MPFHKQFHASSFLVGYVSYVRVLTYWWCQSKSQDITKVIHSLSGNCDICTKFHDNLSHGKISRLEQKWNNQVTPIDVAIASGMSIITVSFEGPIITSILAVNANLTKQNQKNDEGTHENQTSRHTQKQTTSTTDTHTRWNQASNEGSQTSARLSSLTPL